MCIVKIQQGANMLKKEDALFCLKCCNEFRCLKKKRRRLLSMPETFGNTVVKAKVRFTKTHCYEDVPFMFCFLFRSFLLP